MNIQKEAELEKLALIKAKNRLLSNLANMPPGSLRIDKNGRNTKWRFIDENNSHKRKIYLSKSDTDLAQKLALKKYLKSKLQTIEEQLAQIDRFLAGYPAVPAFQTIFPEYTADFRSLLAPYMEARQEPIEKWLLTPFESNPEFPERLKVPTKAGVFVRSKSEAMIAGELFDNHIPFRYECLLSLNDLRVYPDFTILDPKTMEKIIIWEHFGLMDTPAYSHSASMKLNAYLDAGYIPGKNLIITYETKDAPLDINYVSLLIHYHFL